MAADTGIADDGTTLLNLPSTAQQLVDAPTDSGDGDFAFDDILRYLVGFQRAHGLAHAVGGRDAVTPASIGAVAGTLDTDGTLAANSDTRVASQKAVKTYADALIAAANAMVFKGSIDCSTNPNYPAANAGDTYRVSVAGKIGGASGTNVEVGDLLLCLTDGTASGTQAAVGAQWDIAQVNIDGAVTGPASSTSGDFATFSGTSGKVVQDSGLALDTTGTLAANSDTKIPSQKAVKTYADTKAPLASPTFTGTLTAATTSIVGGTGTVALTVKGAASQHIQDWQNSSGSVVVWIDSSSNIETGGQFRCGGEIGKQASTALTVSPISGGGFGIILRGASGQTSDLMQIQATGGTLLAVHNAGGTYQSESATGGIILKSPNAHYWRLTIDNTGTVTWTDLGTARPTS